MAYIDYESLQNADVSPVEFVWNVLEHARTKMSLREVFEHYVSHTEPCIQDLAYWCLLKSAQHPFADQVNIARTIAKLQPMFSQSCYLSLLDFVESVGAVKTPIEGVPATPRTTARRILYSPVQGTRNPLYTDPYLISYGAFDTLDQSILLIPVSSAVLEDAGIYMNNDVELLNHPTARHYTYILRNRGSVDGLLGIIDRLHTDPDWDNGEPKRILISDFSYVDRVAAVTDVFAAEVVS